jgi:hypothetical protein
MSADREKCGFRGPSAAVCGVLDHGIIMRHKAIIIGKWKWFGFRGLWIEGLDKRLGRIRAPSLRDLGYI